MGARRGYGQRKRQRVRRVRRACEAATAIEQGWLMDQLIKDVHWGRQSDPYWMYDEWCLYPLQSMGYRCRYLMTEQWYALEQEVAPSGLFEMRIIIVPGVRKRVLESLQASLQATTRWPNLVLWTTHDYAMRFQRKDIKCVFWGRSDTGEKIGNNEICHVPAHLKQHGSSRSYTARMLRMMTASSLKP